MTESQDAIPVITGPHTRSSPMASQPSPEWRHRNGHSSIARLPEGCCGHIQYVIAKESSTADLDFQKMRKKWPTKKVKIFSRFLFICLPFRHISLLLCLLHRSLLSGFHPRTSQVFPFFSSLVFMGIISIYLSIIL